MSRCNWVLRLRAGACLVGTVQATITADGVAGIARVIDTPWQRRGPVRTVAAAAGLTPTEERQDGKVRWHRQQLPR